MDEIHFFLFVEDQIGELLVPVYEDEPIIIIGRAVVWLALTDAGKGPINIIIGDIVFLSQVPIEKAELSQPDASDLFRRVIVINMFLVVYIDLIDASESQLAKSEQDSSLSLFLNRSHLYHFRGRLMAIRVPIMPAIVPVIRPPITSVGKCTTR